MKAFEVALYNDLAHVMFGDYRAVVFAEDAESARRLATDIRVGGYHSSPRDWNTREIRSPKRVARAARGRSSR